MDLGKVTVFSGFPPDKKRLLQTCSRNVWGQVFATLPLPLIVDDMCSAQPFLRSNGSGTNPTMKGAATPVSSRQEEAAYCHLSAFWHLDYDRCETCNRFGSLL